MLFTIITIWDDVSKSARAAVPSFLKSRNPAVPYSLKTRSDKCLDGADCQMLFRARDLYIFLALLKSVDVKFSLAKTSEAIKVERISPLGSLADKKCEMNIKAPAKLKSLSKSGV